MCSLGQVCASFHTLYSGNACDDGGCTIGIIADACCCFGCTCNVPILLLLCGSFSHSPSPSPSLLCFLFNLPTPPSSSSFLALLLLQSLCEACSMQGSTFVLSKRSILLCCFGMHVSQSHFGVLWDRDPVEATCPTELEVHWERFCRLRDIHVTPFFDSLPFALWLELLARPICGALA